jgi:NADH:ubiquinone oxidoreductase subunit 4 (subunit M)
VVTAILFIPVVGALIVALLPREQTELPRAIALLFSGAAFALSIVLFIVFDRNTTSYQYINHFTWLDASSIGSTFSLQYKVV